MERYPPSFYNQPRFPRSQQNPNNPPESSSRKMFWILGLVLLMIIGALVYILIIAPNQETNSENNIGEVQPPAQSSQSLISCENWDCFVDASEDCSKANFTNTISIDIFGIGINNTGTIYYELKGTDGSECIFYIRAEEYSVIYTDEFKQQMLESGATQEELDQAEQQANEDYDPLEGRDGQCLIKKDDLTNVLTRWADGNFSGWASCSLTDSEDWECDYIGDWEVFSNCEGDYFNYGTSDTSGNNTFEWNWSSNESNQNCGNGILDSGELCDYAALNGTNNPYGDQCNFYCSVGSTSPSWKGCRGNGVSICTDNPNVTDQYFTNHSLCVRNNDCNGVFYYCNDIICPEPE